jgi:hypothetical protein
LSSKSVAATHLKTKQYAIWKSALTLLNQGIKKLFKNPESLWIVVSMTCIFSLSYRKSATPAFSKPACPSRESASIISSVKEWKRHLKIMNLRHLLLSTAP